MDRRRALLLILTAGASEAIPSTVLCLPNGAAFCLPNGEYLNIG